MKEINPKRCSPGIYKVTLKDIAVKVDEECSEEEIIELIIETITEQASQDAPLLIVHKLQEVNVKVEIDPGEVSWKKEYPVSDERYDIFSNRVRSLLDKWQKFNDVAPNYPHYCIFEQKICSYAHNVNGAFECKAPSDEEMKCR